MPSTSRPTRSPGPPHHRGSAGHSNDRHHGAPCSSTLTQPGEDATTVPSQHSHSPGGRALASTHRFQEAKTVTYRRNRCVRFSRRQLKQAWQEECFSVRKAETREISILAASHFPARRVPPANSRPASCMQQGSPGRPNRRPASSAHLVCTGHGSTQPETGSQQSLES